MDRRSEILRRNTRDRRIKGDVMRQHELPPQALTVSLTGKLWLDVIGEKWHYIPRPDVAVKAENVCVGRNAAVAC